MWEQEEEVRLCKFEIHEKIGEAIKHLRLPPNQTHIAQEHLDYLKNEIFHYEGTSEKITIGGATPYREIILGSQCGELYKRCKENDIRHKYNNGTLVQEIKIVDKLEALLDYMFKHSVKVKILRGTINYKSSEFYYDDINNMNDFGLHIARISK